MINENLSKICEFGIWLIQWFGDFSKDIKALQIRNLNSTIQFLVAPLKILILKRIRIFCFILADNKPQILRLIKKTLQVTPNKCILKQANLKIEISLFFSFIVLLPEDSSRNNLS